MNDKEKQEQQGQPPSQSSDQQSDKSPQGNDESTASGETAAGSPPKVRGCFDDIETGEGTGARGGEYS